MSPRKLSTSEVKELLGTEILRSKMRRFVTDRIDQVRAVIKGVFPEKDLQDHLDTLCLELHARRPCYEDRVLLGYENDPSRSQGIRVIADEHAQMLPTLPDLRIPTMLMESPMPGIRIYHVPMGSFRDAVISDFGKMMIFPYARKL